MKCPICRLPLTDDGYHVNGDEAWNEYECEYTVRENGKTHPPLTSPPQKVLDDEFYQELQEKELVLDAKIARLRKKLEKLTNERSIITGTMSIRELKVIKPVASIKEEVGRCIKWCACVRCKAYRMKLAEKEQEASYGKIIEAISSN